jgi:hypothetical protein
MSKTWSYKRKIIHVHVYSYQQNLPLNIFVHLIFLELINLFLFFKVF